jgi:flagellar basal-body rod modification protein FlgD
MSINQVLSQAANLTSSIANMVTPSTIAGHLRDTNHSTTDSSKQLSQEDFISLLMAQLKTQNPTDPLDSQTMMSQVSNLTSLKATDNMKNTVEALSAQLGSSQMLAAAGLVGKDIVIGSNDAVLTQDRGMDAAIKVAHSVDHAMVTIRRLDDSIVKTIDMGALPAGIKDFHWDGLDNNGEVMAAGQYKISAETNFGAGKQELETLGSFKVKSVSLEPATNSFVLNIDGNKAVKMQEVVRIV